MAWDETKIDGGAGTTGQLPSSEWNTHVTDQKGHAARHNTGGSDAVNLTDQTRNVVTVAQNTVYQNTTGRAILLIIIATTNGQVDITLNFGASNPPTENKSAFLTFASGWYGNVFAVIQNNEYYKLTSGGTLSAISAYYIKL